MARWTPVMDRNRIWDVNCQCMGAAARNGALDPSRSNLGRKLATSKRVFSVRRREVNVEMRNVCCGVRSFNNTQGNIRDADSHREPHVLCCNGIEAQPIEDVPAEKPVQLGAESLLPGDAPWVARSLRFRGSWKNATLD
jgi:hypothetical protein